MNFPLYSIILSIIIGKMIYFYLEKTSIFIKCGKDPISPDVKIRYEDYTTKNFVIIKAVEKGPSMNFTFIMSEKPV